MFIENSNLTSIIYLFYLFYANPHCLLCRLITMLSMPAGRQLQTVGWDHLTVSLRTTDSVIDKVGWRWKSNVEGEAKVAGRMSPHSDYDCHFEFGCYQFKHEEELCLVFSNRYSYIEQTRRQWMGSKHRRCCDWELVGVGRRRQRLLQASRFANIHYELRLGFSVNVIFHYIPLTITVWTDAVNWIFRFCEAHLAYFRGVVDNKTCTKSDIIFISCTIK